MNAMKDFTNGFTKVSNKKKIKEEDPRSREGDMIIFSTI